MPKRSKALSKIQHEATKSFELNGSSIFTRVKGIPAHFHPGLFLAVSVNLYLDAVRPGAPIPFTWNLHTLPGSGLDPGSVTASIYLDTFNEKLFSSQPVPLVQAQFGLDTLPQNGLIAPPPNGGAANELYRIGVKTLRLDVESDKTGAVFSTYAELSVIADPLVAWEWLDPEGTKDPSAPSVPQIPFHPRYDFLINHDYKLFGCLRGLAQNPNLGAAGFMVLIETPFGTSNSVEVQTVSFLVGPGGRMEFLFEPIKKDWGWLISGVWVRNFSQPLSKTFVYTVRYAYSDSYGNFYNDVMSYPITISVRVSDEKQGYASGALAALGVGIIAAIFSFGAGLSAAQAIAGGLGKKALDPPELDSRYRDEVIVAIAPNRFKDTKDRFKEIVRILELAERFVILVEAHGDVHNRLLGAAFAKDKQSINLQRKSLSVIDDEIATTVSDLIHRGADAVTAIQDEPEFNRNKIEKTLRIWERYGIPNDVRNKLSLSGCTGDNVRALQSSLREQSVVEIAQDVAQTISLLVYSLFNAAVQVHRTTVDILARKQLR